MVFERAGGLATYLFLSHLGCTRSSLGHRVITPSSSLKNAATFHSVPLPWCNALKGDLEPLRPFIPVNLAPSLSSSSFHHHCSGSRKVSCFDLQPSAPTFRVTSSTTSPTGHHPPPTTHTYIHQQPQTPHRTRTSHACTTTLIPTLD